MAKIYVSSTYNDLQEYRAQVERVIRRMGHEDVAMEYYVAEDQRPVDRCLSDVAACDLYIGIFAWRYGWIPKKNNRKKLSITEMEYRQAEKTNKKILIFLLSDEAPWQRKFMDKDTTAIEKLRDEASEAHGCEIFKSADELGRKVAEAIYKWEKDHGYIPSITSIPEYNLDAYYQALRKRYQTLALEGLTPPQKEEYLQIQLRSVFVEQNVRESPPPVELPKEVWDKLQRDKDVHPEDLPSGITFDDFRHAREVYFEKPPRPVLDVLTDARHQQTIILGDPGSGKSTLARYILLSLIDPSTPLRTGPNGDEKLRRAFDGYLPLLIELRTYTGACLERNCDTFLEFFEYLGKTEGWHLTQAALHHHLKNDGRAVVIFDGLDEIFDPEKREQITRQIVGFANDYPKVRIIVTSRVIGYRRKILTDAGFTHFTLQDLDEKQVETFVNRWYDLAMSDRPDEAKERKERILKSFKDTPSIRQLAGNPMLLTIMAIIGKHQELPRERWKLYDHAASVLIQHWDVNKHLKDQRVEADFIGEDDKKELLRRLAFKMQGAEGGLAGNYIHRDELQSVFENYLIQRYSQTADRAKVIAEKMIQQFRERNFILSLYGANLYGFVHRAFLEYFCASAFVRKFEKTRELTIEQLKTDVYGKHWEDQSWHEVLRLICGMVDEKWAGEIIDYLVNELYQSWPAEFESRPPLNIALAIRCIGEIRNIGVIDDIIQEAVNKMFELFEYGMFFDLRLQKFIHHHLLPAILNIRGSISNHQLLILWITRFRYFLKFEHWLSYCPADLGKIIGSLAANSDIVRNFLINLIKDQDIIGDNLDFVIWSIAEGWKDYSETKKILKEFAASHSNDQFRQAAIEALIEYLRNDPEILNLIKDRILVDNNKWIRRTIADALVEYFRDDPQTLPLLRQSGQILTLARYFKNDLQTLSFARELAINGANEDIRSDAVLVLGWYAKDPNSFNLISDLCLKDSHEEVRRSAVYSLIMNFKERYESFALASDRAINDPHWRVRSGAVNALAFHAAKDPRTLSLMIDRAINDDHEDVRYAAVERLAEHFKNDLKTLPLLLDRAVKDKHHNVRRAAILSLAKNYNNEKSIMPLLCDRAVNEPFAFVRAAALSSLCRYFRDDPKTLALLRDRMVNDVEPYARKEALLLLLKYFRNNPCAFRLLYDLGMKDKSPLPDDKKESDSYFYYVRELAILALAYYFPTDPDTILVLEDRAKNDPTPWLRERAKELLEELLKRKQKMA